MIDLMEVTDERIIADIRKRVESTDLWINTIYTFTNTAAEREALIHFIHNYPTKVGELAVWFLGWNENDVSNFFTAIQTSNIIKVCQIFILDFSYKSVLICEFNFFPKILFYFEK